jgi:hypothetical protein
MEFSRCARDGAHLSTTTDAVQPASRGLSKLNSVLHVEVDVVSRRAVAPDGPKTIDGHGACRSKSSGIP